jgi:hypothetical protein
LYITGKRLCSACSCQGHVRVSHPDQEHELHKQVSLLRQRLRQAIDDRDQGPQPMGGPTAAVDGEEEEAPWRIVFGHHPIWTGGRKHSVLAECLREPSYNYRGSINQGYGLGPLLAQEHVAMYLCGHEHVLQ